METTIETNELVAVNNSSSKTNKIFKVIMMMLLLLSPILVSCQSNSNSNSEDFSEYYKANVKEYKNYNHAKGVEVKFSSIASEPAAVFILQLDNRLGFELWDYMTDWDSPEMYVELPFYTNNLSSNLAITPIVATYPGDPDPNKSDDERGTFLSSRNKNMWFIDYFENNRSYHYIYTEKDKNKPRIIIETKLNDDKNSSAIINILIRKDVSEKDLDEYTYKQVMNIQ